MSEFKIIKCPSCDAPLVELKDQKLKKCIQCGDGFSLQIKKKGSLSSIITEAIEKNSLTVESSSNVNPNTQVSTNTRAKIKTKTRTIIPEKTKSIIGTIVKWYVILFIISKFLRGFF